MNEPTAKKQYYYNVVVKNWDSFNKLSGQIAQQWKMRGLLQKFETTNIDNPHSFSDSFRLKGLTELLDYNQFIDMSSRLPSVELHEFEKDKELKVQEIASND